MQGTISQYFGTIECIACGEMTREGVCQQCRGQPQTVLTILGSKIRSIDRSYNQLREVRSF